jgi:protease II
LPNGRKFAKSVALKTENIPAVCALKGAAKNNQILLNILHSSDSEKVVIIKSEKKSQPSFSFYSRRKMRAQVSVDESEDMFLLRENFQRDQKLSQTDSPPQALGDKPMPNSTPWLG